MQAMEIMAARAEPVSNKTAESSEDAFNGLFVREYRRVVSIAFRVVNDADEAEDIAQEAFAEFHGRHNPEALYAPAWLHRAAVHRALNVIRSRKRRVRRETAEVTHHSRVAPSSVAEGPDAGVERAERQSEVRAALSRIPPRSANVLALRYSGLSYAEVAEAMRCRVGDVGTMLRRAEAAFRKEFDHETRQ
jgi:RNA polymerase sigma factor (sigma-70 family)